MHKFSLFFRFGAVCVVLLSLVPGKLLAQAATPATAEDLSTKVAGPDDLSQGELLKSYLRLREQLHTAELTIVNNRLEAEAIARAQAANITEKLEAIRTAMAAERESQHAAALREAAERERQQREAQQANRTILSVAAAFGGAGLLAMLFTALFQWRAMNRMTEVMNSHPQLPAPAPAGLLTADAGAAAGQTVSVSNQRLMSVIERMERRIFELEHTAHRSPAAAAEPTRETTPTRSDSSADQTAQITSLLAKGRTLLNTNKPKEAVTCYDEILELAEDHPEALLKKGVAMERLKQDHEAIRYYDRAIEVDRKMTLAYLYKGGVCNRQQRYDEALECYEQALQAEETVK